VLSPHTALFAPCTVWGQRWNHPIVCTDSSPTTESDGIRNIVKNYYRKTNKVVARSKREANPKAVTEHPQPEAVMEHPQPEATPEAMTEHPQPTA